MSEAMLSLGLDVGTSTTSLVLSRLEVENLAGSFCVPEMSITRRQVIWQSPVYFTPLLGQDRVDSGKIREIVTENYEKAGISREQVDTGAIIITGETSRKENAAQVLKELSGFAGEFVVATAGPHLESVLAAKGAGAVEFSQRTGENVIHMDIGGGTANLAWIQEGKILKTACLNVGGRLVKLDDNGRILYRSEVVAGLFAPQMGSCASHQQLEELAQLLTNSLETAVGLRNTPIPESLLTQEENAGDLSSTPFSAREAVLSFSGGVAACMEKESAETFGDIGPILAKAIRESSLCQGKYRLGDQTIRATVIGAGCHSTQLSGSTVYHRNVDLPVKNLEVVPLAAGQSGEGKVLWISSLPGRDYNTLGCLARQILEKVPQGPILVALEQDVAKALGQIISLMGERDRPVLCLDRLHLGENSYLDIGSPIGPALPVVIKTLVLAGRGQSLD